MKSSGCVLWYYFEIFLFSEEVQVTIEYVIQRGAMLRLKNYEIAGILMHVT